MSVFADPLANFILGMTVGGGKIRRRKPTRLESYSITSYARFVSRLRGAPARDYAAAIRPLVESAAEGAALELNGPAPEVAETARDIDISALEKAIKAEIQVSEAGIYFVPTATRWISRLALWLACDLVDRNLEKSLYLTLTPAGKEAALHLLHREIRLDTNGTDWLRAMAPDWRVRAGVVGFNIAGVSASVAPYRAEIELESEIIGNVCDILIAQCDHRTYAHEWRSDARRRISQMKESLLRLGFSECDIPSLHLLGADACTYVGAIEKECKGKPYPHQFFAEVESHQTQPCLAIWHVSAENDPNILAGTISCVLKEMRISHITRPEESGAKLLYYTSDGKLLARLAVVSEEALKAAAPHYKKLVIAEIFSETLSGQEE